MAQRYNLFLNYANFLILFFVLPSFFFVFGPILHKNRGKYSYFPPNFYEFLRIFTNLYELRVLGDDCLHIVDRCQVFRRWQIQPRLIGRPVAKTCNCFRRFLLAQLRDAPQGLKGDAVAVGARNDENVAVGRSLEKFLFDIVGGIAKNGAKIPDYRVQVSVLIRRSAGFVDDLDERATR